MNTLFIKEALKRMKTQGSIFQSSSFLCKRMLKFMIMKENVVVVELGAGTGVFTKEIIKRLPNDGTLLVFEINKNQANFLRENIKDKRVYIIEDDAMNLGIHLTSHNFLYADYIISGLPLGNFSKDKKMGLLKTINEHLSAGGTFMQFQYFLQSWSLIKKYFSTKISCYEYRNIPPAFVYECKKRKVVL